MGAGQISASFSWERGRLKEGRRRRGKAKIDCDQLGEQRAKRASPMSRIADAAAVDAPFETNCLRALCLSSVQGASTPCGLSFCWKFPISSTGWWADTVEWVQTVAPCCQQKKVYEVPQSSATP